MINPVLNSVLFNRVVDLEYLLKYVSREGVYSSITPSTMNLPVAMLVHRRPVDCKAQNTMI